MKRPALRVLEREHLALRAVGRILAMEAEILHSGGRADIELMSSIVKYLETFPNRIHHPKEEAQIFLRMRLRAAERCTAILGKLLADHQREAEAIIDLAAALAAYARNDTGAATWLSATAGNYAKFLDKHIDLENQEAFPLAEQLLTEEDWRAVDADFLANDDPLANNNEEGKFAELHRRIISLGAPPPGL
jgi:branched-chain amino acid transport system ATP-binding protein